jgi:hypothetical protein
MVSSGYVALGAFLSVLQLVAAAVATVVGARSWFARGDRPDVAQDRLEQRTYLSALLSYLVLGLSFASWLVFYLILDGFVPQWPGAMCIYGITQIGTGSSGIYGWLPTLVTMLQALKPILVFAAGAGVVLYRFYRQLGTRTLLPRVAALFFTVALLALLDATTVLAYLSIPKRENVPTSGCCSVSSVGHEGDVPPDADAQERLSWTYYGCQLLMVALLSRGVMRQALAAAAYDLALAGVAVLSVGVSLRFFIDVASPRLLHLPYHHCLYDLVPGVPESGVALALLIWATFCVGWGSVVSWLGRSPESSLAAQDEARRWRAYALVGYAGSVAMLSLDLWLA